MQSTDMKRKIALISGATSGIGRASALALAKEGYDIIACGRREEKLKSLGEEVVDTVRFIALVFDIRKKEEVSQAIDSLSDEWLSIDVLINNAGNAHGLDPIHEGNVEDWDAMIDINLKGLLYLSRKVIPGMVEREKGQIINIGSTAGKEVYLNGNVYCASKHAVDALTKGMRMDLNPYGIKVMAIHPGSTETEFSLVRFKGDERRAASVYEGFQPLKAEDIAEIVAFAVTRPPHVVMADVVITPTAQASASLFHKEIK